MACEQAISLTMSLVVACLSACRVASHLSWLLSPVFSQAQRLVALAAPAAARLHFAERQCERGSLVVPAQAPDTRSVNIEGMLMQLVGTTNPSSTSARAEALAGSHWVDDQACESVTVSGAPENSVDWKTSACHASLG